MVYRSSFRLYSFATAIVSAVALCDVVARPVCAESPADQDDRRPLVDRLGDDRFAVRESATSQLIQRGVQAKPILLLASNSSDTEVKLRARRILSIVVDADYQRRRAAFQADHDGSANTSLPGWDI